MATRCPTHPTRVKDLHLDPVGRGRGLLRGQEPGDRGHQPGQSVAVHGVRTPEVVDHLRYRGPRVRVPLVVCELQVGHHRPVPVRPPRFSQVHAYTKSRLRAPCRATRHKSCAYTISPIPDPLKPLTRPNTLRKARICLRTAEA